MGKRKKEITAASRVLLIILRLERNCVWDMENKTTL
jgi:hypothetical protein